jgi:hypothetical protein
VRYTFKAKSLSLAQNGLSPLHRPTHLATFNTPRNGLSASSSSTSSVAPPSAPLSDASIIASSITSSSTAALAPSPLPTTRARFAADGVTTLAASSPPSPA